MSHIAAKVTPRSRKMLSQQALVTRAATKVADKHNFCIVKWLEHQLSPHAGIEIYIEHIDAMKDTYALAVPSKNEIWIREDVYEDAYNGVPRHRYTLAHEVGHALLHRPENVVNVFPRGQNIVKAFEEPEWQANTFAAELLVPRNLVTEDMTVYDIVNTFGVSHEVASIQHGHLVKDGLIKIKTDQFFF